MWSKPPKAPRPKIGLRDRAAATIRASAGAAACCGVLCGCPRRFFRRAGDHLAAAAAARRDAWRCRVSAMALSRPRALLSVS